MITGDSAFTANDVARRLGMLNSSSPEGKDAPGSAQKTLLLHSVSDPKHAVAVVGARLDKLVWRSLHDVTHSSHDDDAIQVKSDAEFVVSSVKQLLLNGNGNTSLCVTGQALDTLKKTVGATAYPTVLPELCPHVSIFARVSPVQKEEILTALKDAGLFVLMCGDGTNDVGALKAAHVGVSIVNDPLFETAVKTAIEQQLPQRPDEASVASGKKKAKGASAKERLARATLEIQAQAQDPTVVKLGDASVASPFTSRRTSIDCVLSVIRQGRCTLVTTIQVFV